MKYLSRSYALAEQRGYLRYPEVVAIEATVPDWFRRLATTNGIAAFEARHSVTLPAALREFYACTALACFLEATIDGEVYLRELAECFGDSDLPPLEEWSSGRHLVVAYHGHSGLVCAAALTGDDPPVFWGGGKAQPISASEAFSGWVFGAVDGYEKYLDYAQGVIEKCAADPAEARRLGGAMWLQRLPGMTERLGRTRRCT